MGRSNGKSRNESVENRNDVRVRVFPKESEPAENREYVNAFL